MPDRITIRFYEELNDFLPHSRRKKAFSFELTEKRSIKDIMESLGVPHTEVDLIISNQQSVDFGYHPQNNDYISVYPVFEGIDISSLNRLRPKPLRDPKFILDVHLGTLARYLRLLGFDTLYRNDLADEEIIARSVSENRIILTRDRQILKNGRVTHGCYVFETNPRKQLKEIISRLDLSGMLRPFNRCLLCNGIIDKVEKEEIEKKLKPNTRRAFDDFFRCSSCGKIYWKGSHYERLMKLIKSSSLSSNGFR